MCLNQDPSKRVLVAEDDDAVREALVELLKSNGWEVVEARDGDEALRLFSQNPTDIVVTDLLMPGLNGLELIPRIKFFDNNTPLIVMSAFASESHFKTAYQAGAASFLEKPVDGKTLLLLLDVILQRQRTGKTTPGGSK